MHNSIPYSWYFSINKKNKAMQAQIKQKQNKTKQNKKK
jgi:hypothetical protein